MGRSLETVATGGGEKGGILGARRREGGYSPVLEKGATAIWVKTGFVKGQGKEVSRQSGRSGSQTVDPNLGFCHQRDFRRAQGERWTQITDTWSGKLQECV